MNEMIASSIPVQTRKPLNYGIHVRLDENWRLLLSDPSRADLAVADMTQKSKRPHRLFCLLVGARLCLNTVLPRMLQECLKPLPY